MNNDPLDLPNQRAPCGQCPFRKDTLEGWLGKDKIENILTARSFVCHKDTGLQCAGHMLIKGDENDFVQLADRLGLATHLRGRELVFDTEKECVDHHSWNVSRETI